jgi:hypothetical protein
MSDTSVAEPVVQPSSTQTTPELTDAQKAEADAWFTQLEKEAEAEKWQRMAVKVPAYLFVLFTEKFPPPEPLKQAQMVNFPKPGDNPVAPGPAPVDSPPP